MILPSSTCSFQIIGDVFDCWLEIIHVHVCFILNENETQYHLLPSRYIYMYVPSILTFHLFSVITSFKIRVGLVAFLTGLCFENLFLLITHLFSLFGLNNLSSS